MSALSQSGARRPVRVFLSYSDLDKVLASKVRRLLARSANTRIFSYDDLSAGEKWEAKLRRELAGADVVVALLTPRSVESSWVLRDVGGAWGLGKPIIPVVTRRDLVTRIPVPLKGTSAIELPDIEDPDNAEGFVGAFENSLTNAHLV